MSTGLRDRTHVLDAEWAASYPPMGPKFAGKLVKGRLGGEVYAFSEMTDRVSLQREFYARRLCSVCRVAKALSRGGECRHFAGRDLKRKKTFAGRC